MGGGIIINRAAVLLPAINDPSFYDYLCASDKERVRAIVGKGAPGCDEGDIRFMAHLLDQIAKHHS
jgi:hypothetical protein